MDRPAGNASEPGPESEAGVDVETDGSGTARPSAGRPSSGVEEIDETSETGAGDGPGPRSWLVGLGRRSAALVSGARIGQFLTVGVLGALFDNALLVALHGFGGVSLTVAKLASAEGAIVLMFACNERWTFAGWGRAGLGDLARRVVTSNLVRFGGVLVATGVLLGLAELGVWYVLANVVGIGVGAVLNYVAESLLTWRVHRG